MSLEEINRRLTEILRDIFDDDALEARPALTADEVEGWDSFAHIRLITTVEKMFDVRFTTEQIMELKTVGDLSNLIAFKTQ